MEPVNFWRLLDQLNIVEATLLIIGEDPGNNSRSIERNGPLDLPDGYEAVKTAISRALQSKQIKGEVVWVQYESFGAGYHEDTLDYYASTVDVDSLKEWLRSKGITSGFFFPDSSAMPDYLNKNHPCYAPKLAGAIRAWEAVQTDSRYQSNGKTERNNIELWLANHAAEFDLLNDKGEAMTSTIEAISKVANWNTRGGAPKTPEPNPQVEKDNPPLASEATENAGCGDFDDDIPF